MAEINMCLARVKEKNVVVYIDIWILAPSRGVHALLQYWLLLPIIAGALDCILRQPL
jgi:hypothetical protein